MKPEQTDQYLVVVSQKAESVQHLCAVALV